MNLLGNLVLARLLTPAEFGDFAGNWATVAIIWGATDLGLGAAIVRLEQDAFDDGLWRRYVSVGVGRALMMAPVSVLAGLLWGVPLRAAATTALVVGASSGIALLSSFAERRHAFRELALLEGLSRVAAQGVAVGLAIGGAGLWALYAREATYALPVLVGMARMRLLPFGAFSRMPSWADTRTVIVDLKLIWAESGTASLFAHGTTLVSKAFLDIATVGLLQQGLRLGQLPQRLLAPVVSRLGRSYFSRVRDSGKRVQLPWHVMLAMSAPFALASLTIGVFAEELLLILYGEQWVGAAPFLRVLSPLPWLGGLYPLIREQRFAARRDRQVLLSRLAQPVPILLLASWGALGNTLSGAMVAAAIVVGTALTVAGMLYAPRTAHPQPQG